MMTSLLRSLFLLAVFLVPAMQALHAAEVDGLYDARVAVASQSAGDRARAVGEGFRQVLVKVSGQRSVLAAPAVQADLGKGESLLGSYRYETAVPRVPGQAEMSAQGTLFIRLAFDPASVRAILNRAGAPVWGASRPPVYLWLVRQGAQGGTLFALGTPQADLLLDAAALRGLPAVIPPPGDTAGADTMTAGVPIFIRDAAARAGAKLVLAASLSGAAGHVKGSGALSVDGVVEHLEASGADDAAVIRELVADAADRLGKRYAVVVRQDQVRMVRLQVAGVGSLAAHAGLERWLAALPLVRDLVVAGVVGDRVEYTLMLAGDVDRLLQAMVADGRFVSIGTPVVDGATTTLDAALAATSAQ